MLYKGKKDNTCIKKWKEVSQKTVNIKTDTIQRDGGKIYEKKNEKSNSIIP